MSHAYAASAVTLLLTLLLGGMARADENTAGLVLHWRFAEPGGPSTYSRTAQPLTGTLAQGAVRVQDGQRGPTMQFDGVDAVVSAGNAAAANVNAGGFSLLVWVLDTNPANASGYVMKDTSDGTNNGFYLYTRLGDVRWYTGTEDLVVVAGLVSAWTHVAVTRAAGTNTLTGYRNGLATVSGTDSRTLNNTTALTVGRSADAEVYPFQGRLASVRLYTRVLGPTEILRMYQQERVAPVPSGLGGVAALFLPGGATGSFFHLFQPQ